MTIQGEASRGLHAPHFFDDDLVASMLGELGRLASERDRLDRTALQALGTLASCCGSSMAAVREALEAALAGDVV